MKTRIQIVKNLIKGTEKWINGEFKNSKYPGLCGLSLDLYIKYKIFNSYEYTESLNIIDSLERQYYDEVYYWERFKKEPRINALKKQLAIELEKLPRETILQKLKYWKEWIYLCF